MHWADYRNGSKKAKVHVGFDVNRGILQKIFLSDGKADERPFATQIMSPGETSIMDRYYQYHIARSEHGLMVQILAGLITYLLLAIYCHEQYNEKVSIKRVRELRIKIRNEIASNGHDDPPDPQYFEEQKYNNCYVKT